MLLASVLSLSLAATGARPASGTDGTMDTTATPATVATIPPQWFSANVSHEIIGKLTAAASLGSDSLGEYPLWHGSSGMYMMHKFLELNVNYAILL